MPTIFLSASVPSMERAERFRRDRDSAFEIEQAVISLARAILAGGGRLVFGGHPTISPLVSLVAGEYRQPVRTGSGEDAAPRGDSSKKREPGTVAIYQSRAFQGHAQEDKLLLFKLKLAEVHWTEAVDGERFDPTAPRRGPPCPKSVDAMREQMLRESKPDAMVCIGGMEGVLDEVKLFRRLREGRRIFVLSSTGGAARILAEEDQEGNITVIDQEVLDDIDTRRGTGATFEARPGDARAAVPYPLIMQTLVERVSRS